MTDIMIDLETLGLGTNALILSIGAQVFYPELNQCYRQRVFEINIDPDDAQRCGQVIDANTVDWWMSQDATTRHLLRANRQSLDTALNQFRDWLGSFNAPTIVWGNGATFDISILEDAYNLLGITTPWKFRNVRDMRTVVDVADRFGIDIPRIQPRTAHNALSDATAQAETINRIFESIRERMTDAIHQT